MNLHIPRYNLLHTPHQLRLFSTKAFVYFAQSNDVVYNLTLEEILFEHSMADKPILFLYQNDKNVVIGKHQNPWKECNVSLMEKENINLARRKSGGGAVYQDMGNLCFAFLSPFDPKVDFKKINTEILIKSLKNIKINAEFTGRNDIVVKGKKISGSAFKINLGNKLTPPRCLHHGTIMLNVNIENLERYLSPNRLKMKSKGVDSVRSRVLNLKDVYPKVTKELIFLSLQREFQRFYKLTDSECKMEYLPNENEMKRNYMKYPHLFPPKIEQLYSLYTSWDWKFGECPEFTNSLVHKFDIGLIDLSMKVNKGIIENCFIYSDCLSTDFIDNIISSLKKINFRDKMFPYSKKGLNALFKDIAQTIEDKDINQKIDLIKDQFINQI